MKGLRLLRAAPVVFVPVSRAGGASYARAIVDAYLEPGRQRVEELPFSMHGDDDGMRGRWRANAAQALETLATGADAVFLTEGDPMLYSTFVHVAGALHELAPDVPIVAVPGISSAFAAAAAAFVPLTDRDERLAVLPATYVGETLGDVLDAFDTVVLLKVASVFDRVLDLLEARGLVQHTVWVRRCGRPEQEIVREVRTLRGRRLDYFSLLIVRRPG